MAFPAVVMDDPELWREQLRFFNFLEHYNLHHYHQKLLDKGVSKISHLKTVDDHDLQQIGFSRSEMNRLRRKLDENFSVAGKLKKKLAGKSDKFDQLREESVPASHSTPAASLIAKEDIKLGKKLGEGAHGTVFEGMWSNVHGAVAVAVKTLYGNHESIQAQFIQEADSMRAMHHPHIIQLYGIVLSSPLMLIEELAPFGNLHQYLKKKGKTLNVELFHGYACQIADAMSYLEDRRVVHRDLAARNILLAAEDIIKLSDFGMARVLEEHSDIYNLSNLQSMIPVAWTALEALQHAKFSSASDVWSYGVTLWEVYSLGKTPWEGLSPIEVRDVLLGGDRLGRPQRCPPDIFKLIVSCWEKAPQDRPTFAKIYEKIRTLTPTLVRAVQSNEVEGDPESLCFRAGDLIYVIERPTHEWIQGMKLDGTFGHFEAEYVSPDLDPIGQIKDKVQSGKTKVTDIPIGNPMGVSHELHWGRDGRRWGPDPLPYQKPISSPKRRESHVSEEESSRASSQNSSQNSSHASSHSSHKPLLGSRSSSPGSATRSPLLSPTNNGGHAAAKMDVPPSQITRGDAKFMGHQRYSPHPISSPEHDSTLPPHPSSVATQQSEDNQYIAIFSRDGIEQGATPPHNPEYDYLQMQPGPSPSMTHPLHTYPNCAYLSHSDDTLDNDRGVGAPGEPEKFVVGQFREQVVAYATSDQPFRETCEDYTPTSSIGPRHCEDYTPTSSIGPRPVAIPLRQDSYTSSEGNPFSPLSTLDTLEEYNARLTAPLQPSTPERHQPKPRDPTPPRTGSHSGAACLPSEQPVLKPRGLFASQKSTSFDAGMGSGPPVRRGKEQSPPVKLPQRSASVYSAGSRRQHDYEMIPSPMALNSPSRLPSSSDTPIPLPPNSNTPMPLPPNSDTPKSPQHSTPKSPTHHLEEILLSEFPDIPPGVVKEVLERQRYNVPQAREELQIQTLMSMGLEHISLDDCRRALSHCQQKMERAASWLLEMSLTLDTHKT